MDRGRPDNPLECAPNGVPYKGSAIRQLRKAKKLGLRQLAALIPYDSGALSKVENNRAAIPSEKLKKIAEILEVDAGELKRKPLHPRLSKQTAGALEQSTTVEQKIEELKAEIKEVKAEFKSEFAEVTAVLKALINALEKFSPFPIPEPVSTGGGGQPSDDLSRRDDLSAEEMISWVDAGSQEPTGGGVIEFNPVRGFVEEVIEAVNDLPDLDKPHSGRIMLTYLVEKDAFGGDRELEEQWLAMLQEAVGKGWDIFHFIWFNDDKERTSHLAAIVQPSPSGHFWG